MAPWRRLGLKYSLNGQKASVEPVIPGREANYDAQLRI
jgi:hypothetical protein